MNKSYFSHLLPAFTYWAASAQEKLEIKVTGRALFDAATYTQNAQAKSEDGKMNEGIGIRDMRVGLKATYGKWYFRGDVSYSNNKVSLKDVYLQYSFNENNFLRAVTTPHHSDFRRLIVRQRKNIWTNPKATFTSQAAALV